MALPLEDFVKVNFGYASAEKESVDAPQLLLNGFIDDGNITQEALEGSRWLFLGYKGSGKSSIGERARLLAQGDPMLFVTSTSLHDFPYSDLTQVLGAEGDDEARYQTAWAWLLLIALLSSIRSDEAVTAEDPGFERSLKELTKLGLLPARDLRTVVIESTTKQFKLQLPKLAERITERKLASPEVAQTRLVEHLLDLVRHFKSEARHVVVIDGLDEVLSRGQEHYQSVASLLLATTRLNAEFLRWGAPAKIVVLCRADLFDRLPGANRNKLRRDWAVFLDWYHDPRDPDASRLIELANLRAGLSLDGSVNIMREFFPDKIREGEIRRHLLDHTRHTPRDFVQVLASIQEIARSSLRPRQRQLTRDQILSGLRDYSISYFLPEIRDELDGYFSADEVEKVIQLLAATRAREFTYKDLLRAREANGTGDLDLEAVVRALFDCSALGTIHTVTSSRNPRGSTRFSFKYRNRNSTVSMDQRFLLHRGVWKAFNLI